VEVVWPILLGFGIPSGIFGLIIWWFKKKIDKNEEKTAERQSNLEQLVLMMMESSRANTVLCKAIGEAVRDGHCNGNMSSALEQVNVVQEKEKRFLLDLGVKHIFE
jgi:plastocyanin domain-containing protein